MSVAEVRRAFADPDGLCSGRLATAERADHVQLIGERRRFMFVGLCSDWFQFRQYKGSNDTNGATG